MTIDYTNTRWIKDKFHNQIWDNIYLSTVTKNYSISFITTCMDRAHDLKRTLKPNLESCKDYPNMKFIIVNYNSKDDLDDYIKNNHMGDIESGLLDYYKTVEPKYYSMSHSRNIGWKLAPTDIGLSLDADVFVKNDNTTLPLPFTINKMANENLDSFFGKGISNLHGMLGLWNKDFISLGGYSEEYGNRYGVEDRCLMLRAFFWGKKFYYFGGAYCKRITTTNSDKVKNHIVKSVRQSEELNKLILKKYMEGAIWNPNYNIHWGKANLTKNFKEEINI